MRALWNSQRGIDNFERSDHWETESQDHSQMYAKKAKDESKIIWVDYNLI